MTTSTMKKKPEEIKTFKHQKMYIHADGDLVVVSIGEGHGRSSFTGMVLHTESNEYGLKLLDVGYSFPKDEFSEFHGEITLTS